VQKPLSWYASGILYTRMHGATAPPRGTSEDREVARQAYARSLGTYVELLLAGMIPPETSLWLAAWEAPTALQVSEVVWGCRLLAEQDGAKNMEELLMELLDDSSVIRGYLDLFSATGQERATRCTEAVLGLSRLSSTSMIRTSTGGGTLRWVSPMYYLAQVLRLKLHSASRGETWLDEPEAIYVDAVLACLVDHGFTPAWIDDSTLTGVTRGLFDTETAVVRYQIASTLHVLVELAPVGMLQAVLAQPANSLVKLSTRAAVNKRTEMDGLGMSPLHVLLSSRDAWMCGTPGGNLPEMPWAGDRVYQCLLALIGLGADTRQKDARGRDALAHLVAFVRENFLSGAEPVATGYDFEQIWPFDNDTAAECLAAGQEMLIVLAKSGADFRQAEQLSTPPAPGATPFSSPMPTSSLPPTLFDQPFGEVTELELGGEEEEEEEEPLSMYATPVSKRAPVRLMDVFLRDAELALNATEVLPTANQGVRDQMRNLVATIRQAMSSTSRKRGFDPGEARSLGSVRDMRISKACAQADLMLTSRGELKSAAESMALAHAMAELKLGPQQTSPVPRPAGARGVAMPFAFH